MRKISVFLLTVFFVVGIGFADLCKLFAEVKEETQKMTTSQGEEQMMPEEMPQGEEQMMPEETPQGEDQMMPEEEAPVTRDQPEKI